MIEVNSLNRALGAYLSQYHNEYLYPVAFHSRKLSPADVTCAGQAFQIWCVALFSATRWRCLSFLSLYTAIESLSIGYTLYQ